jgi:lipopolysaccharide/colanic/teichoic acid biosynthesis glycosyltransferase
MGLLKDFTLRAGILIILGAPPYLAYDLFKITQGDLGFFHSFLFMVMLGILCPSVIWALRLRGPAYERIKPYWERPLAFVVLLICSPLLLLSAMLIKLESDGPFLYRQRRVGKNQRKSDRRKTPAFGGNGHRSERRKEDRRREDLGGRPFDIFKLRSMYVDAETRTGAAWSTGDADPRVTKTGYFIRKTHLDELPQFFNVLFGHMSVIGPRPERPDFITKLSESVERYRERLLVPAGITGLAQVNQDADETLEDVRRKVQYDTEYAQNMSLLLDCKIVFLTVFLVLQLFWNARRKRPLMRAEPRQAVALLNEPAEIHER